MKRWFAEVVLKQYILEFIFKRKAKQQKARNDGQMAVKFLKRFQFIVQVTTKSLDKEFPPLFINFIQRSIDGKVKKVPKELQFWNSFEQKILFSSQQCLSAGKSELRDRQIMFAIHVFFLSKMLASRLLVGAAQTTS